MDTRTKQKFSNDLACLKFTGFLWKGEEGFYYSRYPEPKEEDKMKGRNLNQQLYYHKICTPQSADVLVYEDPANPQRFANGFVTEDERLLCLYTSEGASGREIRVNASPLPKKSQKSALMPSLFAAKMPPSRETFFCFATPPPLV